MIISVSRRTDVPCFFSDWFYNRVQEGYVCVRNPMSAHQVSRITLTPDVVDCFVFWSKNPGPMIDRLGELEGFNYYFQFTLTGYGHDIEAGVPHKRNVMIPTFQRLAQMVGPERVVWRYDPIAFSSKYTTDYHLHAFESIATALRGCTERCVISFVDTYQKNKARLREAGLSDQGDSSLESFARELANVAKQNGMSVGTCAEKIDLAAVGIEHNACVSRELIQRIAHAQMKVGKDTGQRTECGCVQSIDIGTYNTCRLGCKYCYANFSPQTITQNVSRYDATSPLLCDALREDDVVTERKMRSLFVPQLSLFGDGDRKSVGRS